MFKSWMWKQRSFREQHLGDEGGSSAGGAASAGDQADQQDDQDDEDADEQADQQPGDADAQAAGDDADDELVVTIGDEAPPAGEDSEEEIPPAQRAAWARMRKTERELKQKVREYEQSEAARKAAEAPKPVSVGDKPSLESCDYDAEKYAQEVVAWNDRKRAADEQAAKARAEQEAANAAWQAKVDGYNKAKATLKVNDFDGAEHVVREALNATQQAVILSGADKPELLVYALGSNPAKAKELAAIKDPVKFAFAVAKLETQLKVQARKTPPAPERQVRGNAGGATSIDNQEARLEAEADRTGDRSALIAYRRNKRQQQAA